MKKAEDLINLHLNLGLTRVTSAAKRKAIISDPSSTILRRESTNIQFT